MASNSGPDRKDFHFTVQPGEFFFHKGRHCLCFLQAGGMTKEAFAGIIQSVPGILFHLLNDPSDDLLFGADLVPGYQPAFVIYIKKRADSHHRPDKARRFGNTPSFNIEGQIRGEEPVMQITLIFLRPVQSEIIRILYLSGQNAPLLNPPLSSSLKHTLPFSIFLSLHKYRRQAPACPLLTPIIACPGNKIYLISHGPFCNCFCI